MSDLRVRLLLPDEPSNWPATLTHAATFTALDAWTSIGQQAYHFPVHRLETELQSGVNGILSLMEIKHPLLGHYLTTAPFGSYGGLAYTDLEARDALLARARALGNELGAEYVSLRSAAADEIPPTGWQQDPAYATFLLDLVANPQDLLKNFSSDHRNHVRKSLKKGFTVKFGQLDLLDDAYEGLAQSMHELGSPYHRKTYLQSMAQSFGDLLEFVVIYGPDAKIAGAGVFIAHGNVITNLHANILRRYRASYAGEFFYWQVIERYCHKGFQTLDLGRSLIGSGNETFKLKWKPRKQLLASWYALKPGAELPHLNQKSPRFRLAIAVWKRLPAFVVRRVGPFLINGLA